MAKYKVEITKSAEKQFKKLPQKEQKRISKLILTLSDNPYPVGSKKLSGYEDIFRIRSGNYRVIYSIYEKTVIVTVLKIGHRKDVYKKK